jgi:hypothetical protein
MSNAAGNVDSRRNSRCSSAVSRSKDPVDDVAKRPVACVPVAAGGAEQLEACVEPVGEVVDGQRAGPRGGQLDGEREAVKGAADVADPPEELRAGREVGVGRARPVQEQLDRGGEHLLGVQRGDSKGCDDQDLLAVDAEALAAGREQPQRGGDHEQLLDDSGDDREQVLAVVEDQKPVSGGCRCAKRVDQRDTRLGVEVERVSDRVGHGAPLVQRAEIHPPGRPVGRRDLLGQAGLADPARADQGDQPPGGQGLTDAGELVFTADGGGCAGGEHATFSLGWAGLDGVEFPAQHPLLEVPQPG